MFNVSASNPTPSPSLRTIAATTLVTLICSSQAIAECTDFSGRWKFCNVENAQPAVFTQSGCDWIEFGDGILIDFDENGQSERMVDGKHHSVYRWIQGGKTLEKSTLNFNPTVRIITTLNKHGEKLVRELVTRDSHTNALLSHERLELCRAQTALL